MIMIYNILSLTVKFSFVFDQLYSREKSFLHNLSVWTYWSDLLLQGSPRYNNLVSSMGKTVRSGALHIHPVNNLSGISPSGHNENILKLV